MAASPCEGFALSTSPDGLRQLLEEGLLTDSDLDAFCIDHFPAVYRQFAGSMDRTRKLNLLLILAPPDALLDHIRSYMQAVPGHKPVKPLPRARLDRMPSRAVPDQTPPLSYCWQSWRLACFVASCLLIAALGSRLLRQPKRVDAAATVPAGSATARSAVPSEPAPLLTSEPTGALIFSDNTGGKLGQTPLFREQIAPTTHSLTSRLCLRAPGFVPVLVTLEPGSESSRPVHVQLQRTTRAAQQRALGQEPCNGPSPIIR